jgi:surfactin synthase thioesterase subunit
VELVAVQLPGRETRFGEPPLASLTAIAEAVADELAAYADRPFAFFGHSMGARVAFEAARALRRRGAPGPSWLFPSASRAPHRRIPDPLFHLPDEELTARLRGFGGLPAEADPDLLEIMLPTLRADLAAAETYVCPDLRALDCPIHGFAGDADPETAVSEMSRWSEQTTGDFRLTIVPGDHFFFLTSAELVTAAIAADRLDAGSAPC